MATMELPPRRSRRTQEMTIQRNRSSLEILVQMGFPKHRAERALAATGDKGVQLASDWLLSHVNDISLDDKAPRDYILYLCPVGQLQQEFLDYWQKSYQECSWNRAHNYFPHITLCSFFQADDSLVSQLSHAIKKVAERVKNAPETVEFDYFSSTNFIGLFITESFALMLKQITTDFADEMKKAGVTVEPHKKQLHVSLAYQFSTEKKDKLETLAKTINLKAPARWDLRLYSRDKIKANCQVRKVLYTHVPGLPDELEMCDGDFIHVNEIELETTQDGWCLGTSWMTGCTGMFPVIYTERTAETETWTMHRSIPIVGTDLVMKFELHSQYADDNMQTLRTARLSGSQSTHITSAYINHSILNYIKPAAAHRNLLTDPSLVEGGSRVDRKVALPSSLLSAIPEASVLPTTTANPVSNINVAPLTTTTSISKTTVPNIKPQSTQVARTVGSSVSVVINASSAAAVVCTTAVSLPATSSTCAVTNSADASQTTVDGRLSSPKHSARIQAIDNIAPLAVTSAKGSRQLYVVRHGERIDFTFGKDWIQNSFNQSGKYIQYDLNMPKSMPKRKSGPQDFSQDSPLTVQGCFQTRLLGEAMREKEISIAHLYASPSLRCVESAKNLLEGLKSDIEINVEPGLFEWLGWYQAGVPKFMSLQELREVGYLVNLGYQPVWPFSKFNLQETSEQFYDRCYQVTKEILVRHEVEGGSILFIAHGVNLDSCTRQLVGQQPRSQARFHEILHKIPYCAMSVAQEATVVRDTWYLIEPPVLPFAHTNNPKYNWTLLTTPGLV